jgi:hypothetical protein
MTTATVSATATLAWVVEDVTRTGRPRTIVRTPVGYHYGLLSGMTIYPTDTVVATVGAVS